MSKLGMAISISRSSSISPLHKFLQRVSRNSYGNTKKRNSVCCNPSELSPTQLELSFCIGTHLIPHPRKIEKGGEDAFFVSNCNGGILAIADGVSGWAEKNIDPALFSRELMTNVSNLIEDEEVNYEPQILLKKAHAATLSVGSATVVVAMLEKNRILKIANVGDCGLQVIRQGKIYFSTSPQEHYFDCPYQLSSQVAGQTYLDAVVSEVELLEGDTIVMGSDGLFDNVFDHEIVSIITRFNDVAEAAKALATLANNHSRDNNFDSPYTIEARRRGYDIPLWKKVLGKKLTGGKLDDITVIIGRVISSP
ncbi:phosphatase PTC7-like protein [Thalictrum thalictroides]|uniref:Protein phosphatase n=1 Tax=Thalictrum thalictroides TaxID=46969 RepID=A0A7J6W6I4_THATH|nr:phosphatase PTC7-like protein [Thalictrum thalictroides]